MLNITRRRGERIIVGDDIFVSVIEVSGQIVRLGIDAPRSVRVYREELWLEIKAQNEAAVQAAAETTLPEGGVPELVRPAADSGAAVDSPPESGEQKTDSPPESGESLSPRS
jgi:carbon storage regulator